MPNHDSSVVVIGAGGQLGSDLMRRLPSAVGLTHDQIEITNPDRIANALGPLAPRTVINTAAYNLVDRAEDEPEGAFEINARGPEQLAQWCAEHDALLVHISTDYVFGAESGRMQPYSESDAPSPINTYGQSKLAGEEHIRRLGPQHLIIRTCGLYGLAATRSKGNFVKTMLRLAGERNELRVVDDQHCTPSFTVDVADAIAGLIDREVRGTVHVTNSGAATWCDVARAAIEAGGLSTPVIPIPSSEYPTRARRPGYSVLDTSWATQSLGRPLPDWRDAVTRYVRDLIAST